MFVSALLVACVFGMFEWSLRDGYDVAYARTASVNTLVSLEVVYYFTARNLRASIVSRASRRHVWRACIAALVVFGLQALMSYAPFMQFLFHTTNLDGITILYIFALAVALLVVLELEKLLLRCVFFGEQRRAQPRLPPSQATNVDV